MPAATEPEASIRFRKRQQAAALQKRPGRNALCHGPPGPAHLTGKMPVPRRMFVQGPAALALGRTLFGPTPPQTPFGPDSRTKCLLRNKDRLSFITENNIIAYNTTT